MSAPTELIRATEGFREKHPHYWRSEDAKAELAALWGEVINGSGVFVNSVEEVLYDRDSHTASISISSAKGVYAFGCRFSTPMQGYGGAPSISGDLFISHAEARTAAIEFLLKRFPEDGYPYEGSQRPHLERMREAVANLLLQPSLF